MKKFKGVRTLEETINLAKEKGYVYRYENFQNRFYNDKRHIDVCLRSLGRFFAYRNGKCVASENSVELDSKKWYQDILDMIYISE